MSVIFNAKSKNTYFVNYDESALFYIREVRKMHIPTAEEQLELAKQTRSSDRVVAERARRDLILASQRFVVSMAKHYTDGTNFNDIISEANIGLMIAIDKFDTTSGVTFLTYASYWMNQRVQRYILSNTLVKKKNAEKYNAYARKARNKFFLENCRYPTPDELHDILSANGVRFGNVDDLVDVQTVFIDEYDRPEDGSSDGYYQDNKNYLEATSSNNVEEAVMASDLKSVAETILSRLEDEERDLICLYFGIGGHQLSVDEIATCMSSTPKKVTKRINNIIKKLRKNGKN